MPRGGQQDLIEISTDASASENYIVAAFALIFQKAQMQPHGRDHWTMDTAEIPLATADQL